MNRRSFLQHAGGAAASAAALLLSRPLSGADAHGNATGGEDAGPSDDEVLAGAKERIAKHRQADCVVTVLQADGKPVPGAAVKIEQLRHEFLFGCNAFLVGRLQDPAHEAEYRRRFAALLNYATLGFYWSDYEPQRGHPNYAYTDKVLEWAEAQGIACKGHPLVWDHSVNSPPWLPDDPADVERLCTARVRDVVARFKGRIDRWDVVNEPTHLGQVDRETRMSKYASPLGQVPYVRRYLDVARAANPGATLLVNDYRLEPRYYEILDALRDAAGKPLFDAVGIQSHMHAGVWPLHRVVQVCDTYAKLGVPLHFTETTVVSGPHTGAGEHWGPTSPKLEEKQAEYTAKLYTTLFAHPAVAAVTWWDFSDASAWQGAPAGWLRSDMSPKPVYDRLMSLIKGEWRTRTQGRTNGSGELHTRLFFGTHRITSQLPTGQTIARDVRCNRGGPTQFTLKAS